MPCYQQAAFVEEAVRSVLDQRECHVELLVFDPGSTDGSREILQQLQGEYGRSLRLFFEPDSGQSDAVNKGMMAAQGEILGWLNSDDRLCPGALARVAESFSTGSPAWLYGHAGMIDAEGRQITSWIARYKNWRGKRFSRLKLLTENFIPQMAVFWNRSMWDAVGGLDPERHLDMDYDLWLRFAEAAEPQVVFLRLADFRVHAAAKGSVFSKAQLDAAFETARLHSAALGYKGKLALLVHRFFGLRTRLFYRFLKP